MSGKIGFGWQIGLLTIMAIMFGLHSYRQYLKYVDGRGIYINMLGPNASAVTQIVVFVVIPFVASLVLAWLFLRDIKR